jgi:protocatechuate 3,4-dioxygenase beta subunit
VTVTIRPIPQPPVLQDLQVAQTTLVVSDTNSLNPSLRNPLDPNLPNATIVTVSVREQNTNQPIQGASVLLSSSDPDTLWVVGSNAQLRETTVLTDAQGQAQATFYTSKKAGTVTITAQLDNQTKTAQITQVPGPALITLSANPTEIFVRLPDNFTTADGQNHDYRNLARRAQITATIADANGNPYENVTVTFTATAGLISSPAVTGSDGKATVDFAALQVPAGGQATVSAQATINSQNLNASVNVRVRPGPPAKVSVAANPLSLPADGRSTATITVSVTDANDNPVKDGTLVTLRLENPPPGTVLLPSGNTSMNLFTSGGQATATLLAGTIPGGATISATSSETISNTTFSAANSPKLTLPIGITLQPLQVSVSQVFVSKSDYTSFGNQYPNTATVTVQVAGGQNLSGVQITLTASDPNVAWNTPQTKGSIIVTTGSDGRAQATYLASPRAGDVVITATLGNQTQTATIRQLPGPPTVQLTANPSDIFVSLQGSQYASLPQQSQITVTVTDENGNPHPNASVQLSTTAGTFAQSSGPTDAQGKFTTTLTAPNQVPIGGRATVTARVTTTRGERIDAQPIDITIRPGPPAIVELRSTKLTLSTSDTATLTATVKDANGNPVPSVNGRTVPVTFSLQVSAANNGKVTLSPITGNTDPSGQVTTTLTTSNASPDTAVITAEAVETLQSTFFRASSSLSVSVGVTPILLSPPEILDASTLVVSNNNDPNPNNRQPLDPALPNSTRVRIRVANTGGQPLPVTFISNDSNTLWQDINNPARTGLGSLTTTLNPQGEAIVRFYASSRKGSAQIKVRMNGQETPSAVIQQVAGLPAFITLTSDKAVVPQGNAATITATITDNAAPQPNPVRQGTRVSFRLISAPQGVSLETPTDRTTPDENGQVSIRLLVANNAANGVATVEARTDNGITQTLSLPVGVSPTLQSLNVTTTTLSVSANNNVPNRTAVNGANLPNQTTVKVSAQNTAGLPIQVTLSSNDPNTLWVDGVNARLQQITVTLDANGEKTVTFVASSTARQVTITASLNGQTQTATITQQPGPPAQITLSADKDVLPNGGTAQLTARVVDAANPPNPVPNATVNFSLVAAPANTTLNPTTGNTSPNGEVSTTLQAPATGSGQATVRAQVTSSLNPPPAQVTLFVGLNPSLQSLSVQTSTLSVAQNDTTTNPADRAPLGPEPSNTQITVQATNTGGQPIPVEFIASDSKVLWDDGTNRALGTLRTNLDANGRATVTYYASSKAGNVQVTVRLNTPNPQTLATVITQLPGNPSTVQLSADKQIVPPSDQATITAVVKDAANNPVRDGTQVTFQLQPGAPAGTSLLPPTTVPTLNGQAQVRLLAGTLSGQATVQAQSGAANANITLFVGVAPTIAPVQVANPNLVVSDSNSTDPAQRRPLDPNAQNNTVVTVQVRGLGGQPVPIILRSSDDNTLWVNRRDTSQRALREITITTDANGVVEALFYTSTRAQTVTITAVVGNEAAQTTIVQKAGPPAQINLALQGFSAAPDGTPYLNIQQQGTIVATVVDANGNPVPNASVNFTLSPNLNGDEGNLNPASAITGADGRVQTTLTASAFSTQVTLRAQTGSVTATQAIRYSVSVPGLTIVANPNQIPDDNATTSVISITSSDANRPLPNGFKFRLSADLGATLTAEVADQPNLVVTVGNGQPAGEGANEARATLKGPSPDLSQTQPRTITVTADLIVDGQPRSFTQTVTLLPRIQVVADFGLSNNPNQLVVSSTNDTDPSRRVPLDTVAGHNKAVLRIRLNGSAAPNPSFVTVSATDPNVLLRALDLDANGNPTNTELGRQLGTLSVNFKPLGNPVTNWDAYVEVYSSTLAGPVTLQLNLLGITRTITYTQIPGLPAIVTVAPDRSVIGVQGMTTLPTSTTVRALIRDAAGNLVTTPGVTVTFNAEAGTLNPTSTQAVNGVATTTLTSNNETRRVRVFATAVQGNAQATGVATMVFAVSVSSISLTTDKPKDQQGRVLLDPNDNVRVIANLSPTGGTPDGTRLQVELTGAYGLIQSVTPVQSNTANALILNNNTTNVDQTAIVRFIAFNEQGLPVSSPDQIILMKGVTVTPIIQLTAAATELKVSTSNDTNENNRNALNPGGPSNPQGANANRTTLTVTLNITGLSANEPVTLTLSSTDLNGLFTNDETQNGETGQLGSLTVPLNADGGGNLNTSVPMAYWASTKAGNFVITAEVKRQNGQVIGQAQLNIVQRPGNPSQIFVTTDPSRLAVSTVTGEPTAARVLATILDANNNPVPNWWVFFQIQPVPVNMNPDTTDNNGQGEDENIPQVSDGGLNPFAAKSDAGGVASSLLQSINTSQPVRIVAIVDANNDGQLQNTDQPRNSVDTVYYVPLLSYSAVVDYTSPTKNIIVTVNPASALPRNTAIWVCRYAPRWVNGVVNDNYAIDNDGDGRFDEDPPGDINGDNNNDDDGQGGQDEDGYETLPPTYYRVIVDQDGQLVVPAFPLGNRESGIVNVRIFIYTKDGTMLRIRVDWVQNP